MKVFVLGLDGATFNCLNALMEQEVIPNIRDLYKNGASGVLKTIFPPVTAPAWLALATGLNPGKTGVFDYINKADPKSQKMLPVSSAYYEDRALWKYLNEEGYKVGIFNYPTLSPPPTIDGFVVSGIGNYGKENLCFPAILNDKINKITNGYEVRMNLRNPKYKKNIDLFFEDLNRIIRKQTKVLRYLVKEREWDFFFAVFSFTDWMQHVLWKDIDEMHPLHDVKTSPIVKEKFKNTWNKIDCFIGELLSFLSNNTNFVIVSDHGMGPIDSVFYANTWLEKMGWLMRKDLRWKNILFEKISLFSDGSDKKYYSSFLNWIKNRMLKVSGISDLIDFDKSLAYSPEHNTMFGCITLTEKGSSTDGFKARLVKEIKRLPETVEGISAVQIYLPGDIYAGNFVDLAPDILFVINDYKSTVEIDFSKKAFFSSPSLSMRTGGHRPEGVFLAKGNIFKPVRLGDISILDIAPTILALYDLKIPSRIDGKVITECINPGVLNSMIIRQGKDEEVTDGQKKNADEGDLEEMKSMLKSLGYL